MTNKKRFVLLLLPLLGLIAICTVNCFVANGRVVAVNDGNTLVVVDTFGHERCLRIYDALAPSLNEAGGFDAKQALEARLLNKHIQYDWLGKADERTLLAKIKTEYGPSPSTDHSHLLSKSTQDVDAGAIHKEVSYIAGGRFAAYPQWE